MQMLVNIDVPDLEEGIRFYRDGLGLVLARRLFDDTTAEMTGAGGPIYLLEKATGSAAPAPRDYRRHWTPVRLDFAVGDLAASVSCASRRGGTEILRP